MFAGYLLVWEVPPCPYTGLSSLKVILRGILGMSWFPGGSGGSLCCFSLSFIVFLSHLSPGASEPGLLLSFMCGLEGSQVSVAGCFV